VLLFGGAASTLMSRKQRKNGPKARKTSNKPKDVATRPTRIMIPPRSGVAVPGPRATMKLPSRIANRLGSGSASRLALYLVDASEDVEWGHQ